MVRPTKRRPQLQAEIIAALKAGNTRTAAAEYVGIRRETLWDWMNKFPTFSNAVIQAEAQAEVRMVTSIATAAPKDWHAAMAWLERRRHADWGNKDNADLADAVRALAKAQGLSDEETVAAIAEAEAFLRQMRELRRAGR